MKHMLLLSVGLIAILMLSFLPLDIPYSVQTLGKIAPYKKWMMVREAGGRITTICTDNLRGVVEDYQVMQVDNGDLTHFKMYPAIIPGAHVSVGDTIAFTSSIETKRQLANLQGELAAEMAALDLYQAGMKSSVIHEAQQQLTYAETQAEQQKKQVARLRGLYKRNAVSEEEVELSENALRLQEIQIAVKKAQLNTAQTGAREQEVEWVYARIEAIKREISILEEKLENAIIKAPFSGFVSGSFSSDTLAVIHDTAHYVVAFPIAWHNRSHITQMQSIEITGVGLSSPQKGKIEYIGDTIWTVQGKPYFSVIVSIENFNTELAPGLVVNGEITYATLRPIEYLWRFFQES